MKTKITKIISRMSKGGDEKFFTIYFDYFGEERFTYLNSQAVKYWKAKGLKTLKVGAEIDVHELKDKKHFKIFGFEEIKV